MVETVDGAIYNLTVNNIEEISACARDFFLNKDHENDLIAVHGCGEDLVYISSADIKNGTVDGENYVRFSVQMFKDVRKNGHFLRGG